MNQNHIVAYDVYYKVWFGLIVLTITTVLLAKMHLGPLTVLAALSVATVKSMLVLYFFMHLKYETFLFKAMFITTIVTLAALIGGVYFDFLFR